jgi:hypothetical protein
MLKAFLSLKTMGVVMIPAAIALTTGNAQAARYRPNHSLEPTPLCYVQFSSQAMRSLDKLCGVGKKSNLIDLTVDADRDGVPDELLAEMRTFQKKMQAAKTSAEYELISKQLEDRMPYSDNVRNIQAQQRQLQAKMASGNGSNPNFMTQFGTLQEQLMKDPSYGRVQEAMGKVYSKL